jgi:flagellar basal-body rod protein FlgB
LAQKRTYWYGSALARERLNIQKNYRQRKILPHLILQTRQFLPNMQNINHLTWHWFCLSAFTEENPMDLNQATLMQMLNAQMRYQSQNQKVLATNIANIDTPGFQPREMKKVEFDRLVSSEVLKLNMKATSQHHLIGKNPLSGPYRDEESRKIFETSPVKNSVSVEQQMAKLSENTSQHQLTTNLFRKYTGMYRTAVNGAR